MNIVDCPGNLLRKTLIDRDPKQQCDSPVSFSFTSSTTQVSMTFTSNAAIESSGFQAVIALDFPSKILSM